MAYPLEVLNKLTTDDEPKDKDVSSSYQVIDRTIDSKVKSVKTPFGEIKSPNTEDQFYQVLNI